MQIIEVIWVGVRGEQTNFVVEVDRHKAIALAIRSAKPGDIVLLAGKGHEKVQIFANETVAFDDVAEAARVLQEVTA
jgi:UDP-N-acetylmuramoyl-L-alanyl-D-glutamate--2,6-diaminopimelate ligase